MEKEPVTCLMHMGANCKGHKRKNLSMIICDKHLKDCYGLEMGFVIHEQATSYEIVGGFLQPADGIVFPKNTVIIPTRHFFDHTIRPEDIPPQHMPKFKKAKLMMNPQITEMMRKLAVMVDSKGDKKDDGTGLQLRFIIEMYRNLTEESDIDLGPNDIQKFLDRKFISLLQSKKAVSISEINTQSILNHISNCYSFEELSDDNNKLQILNLNEMPISLIMKYIIVNCLFSAHVYDDEGKIIDYMMPNCQWNKDAGLVTLEDIGKPNYLIFHGVRHASQIFYNAIVSSVMKQILTKKVDHRDAMSQYHMANGFRGASTNCL